MNLQTLRAMAIAKNWNQSDLAAAAGVSRQRVSQWFHELAPDGFINIQMSHARALAKALDVNIGELVEPWPILADRQRLRRETTRLLWDHLYPDIVSLLTAARDGRKDALARIVQVYGLFGGAKLFGASIWRDFPKFKALIKPARRAELEHLWCYRQSQMKA